MINYENGRAYALAGLSQDILQNALLFKAWADGLISAMKQPIVATEPSRVHVTIYTDGACSGNPGPGGWGAILMVGEHKKELSGSENETTNNRMELYAAIEALSALKKPCEVKLHSDSAYLVNAFTNGWIQSWMKNDWRKSDKKPVENKDLWEQLVELTGKHAVTFVKVKGHSDNEFNNRCDEMAVAAYRALMVPTNEE